MRVSQHLPFTPELGARLSAASRILGAIAAVPELDPEGRRRMTADYAATWKTRPEQAVRAGEAALAAWEKYKVRIPSDPDAKPRPQTGLGLLPREVDTVRAGPIIVHSNGGQISMSGPVVVSSSAAASETRGRQNRLLTISPILTGVPRPISTGHSSMLTR